MYVHVVTQNIATSNVCVFSVGEEQREVRRGTGKIARARFVRILTRWDHRHSLYWSYRPRTGLERPCPVYLLQPVWVRTSLVT